MKKNRAAQRRDEARTRRIIRMAQQITNPEPIGNVVITVFNNGACKVAGFPPNHMDAMHIMANAQVVVANYFVRQAIEGRYPEESQIITPTAAQIVGLGGKE